MTQNAAFKAMIKLASPNIISPQRATNRIRFFVDELFKLTDPVHLDGILSADIKQAEETNGKTKELLAGVIQFKKKIITLVSRDEKAIWGVINEIKDEEKEIEKEFREITRNIKDAQRKKTATNIKGINSKILQGVNDDVYKNCMDLIHQKIAEIKKLYKKELEELENRELLLSRERDQMRGYVFKFDNTIKSEISFFFGNLKNFNKSQDREIKRIREMVGNDKNMKDELEKFLRIVSENLKLIFNEIIDLIEILIRIKFSMQTVYEKHIIDNLTNKMGLSKRIRPKVKNEFDEIYNHIKEQAEIDFEAIKIVLQDFDHMKTD
jgi:hypothetical protein